VTIIIFSLWISLGPGLAFLFLKSQQWTVGLVNPEKPKFSQWIVIGGAFVRWLIITGFLLIALYFSIISMLTLFFSFLVSRIFILILWDQTVFSDNKLSKLN